jgi:hypothetical protein
MRTALFSFFVILTFSFSTISAADITDKQIRQAIIQQSIQSYPGNCPCPYNTDRAGRSCGKRSAYSKPGGYAPLCYPQDISDKAVKAYRQAPQ